MADFFLRLRKDLCKYKYVYLLAIPVLLYYLLFCYMPMYGASIAFKDFSPGLGVTGSPWVGVKHFQAFFSDIYFPRLLRNTLMISAGSILFGFPLPILLALMLNEVKGQRFKRVVQTASYLPHFISLVVICGLVLEFVSKDGLINDIIALFGGSRVSMLLNQDYFRPIYILSDIWQSAGWNSIIYLAALAGVDQDLYEAAEIDGAGRFQKMLHVTLPGISATIGLMFILRMGSMMSIGYEKIILLYNPAIYETADVISSYVYRTGLINFNYSYSTAVGLFNSVVNLFFLFTANYLSRKCNDSALF